MKIDAFKVEEWMNAWETGANHHVFYSLIELGDRVISIMPTCSGCRSQHAVTSLL